MIKTNPSLCTGCRICEIVCSITHGGDIAPKRSRIRIRSQWPEEEKIEVCFACGPKPCIEACPEGALAWKDHLRLDEEKCTGCFLCTEACPYVGIHSGSSENFPYFCDTCSGEFQCVAWCPTKAVNQVT
jgi:Fe-S-cluster-containing hydrogenase component 2